MSVIITGVSECLAGMAKMVQRQHEATRAGLEKSAHLLEREIKAELSVTSTTGQEKRDTKGRFAKRGSTHSAPGEPPFLISGDLRRSVQVDGPNTVSGTQWEASVGPTVVYGRIQELGGDTGRGHATHLEPRPYVAPALEKMLPVMQETMKAAWRAGQAM